MANFVPPTEADIEAAIARGAQARATTPRAEAARYDAEARQLVLTLQGGVSLAFPPDLLPELADLPPDALAQLVVGPAGDSLEHDPLDLHVSLGGLLLEVLRASGWKDAIRAELNREVARIKSDAKAASSRENGKRGGRPRKDAGPKPTEPAPPAAT